MNDIESPVDLEFLRRLSLLYVEDEPEVRESLARYLRRRFAKVDAAGDGARGLELYLAEPYDVVVTDVRMPGMDGLEMARRIKSVDREVPVIIVTAYNEVDYFTRAIEIGVDRYVKKPLVQEELLGAIYHSARARLEVREGERRRLCAFAAIQQALTALAQAIDKRSPHGHTHQPRVARLAMAIAEDMKLSEKTILGLGLAAAIHDIGLFDIPETILQAPRALVPAEFARVEAHAQAGHDILRDIDSPWPIARIILQHHERLDGSGYPYGLEAADILLEARILAVADVVEAMLSERPYRPVPPGFRAAQDEIKGGRGTRYDPRVVDSCLRVLEKGLWETEQPLHPWMVLLPRYWK